MINALPFLFAAAFPAFAADSGSGQAACCCVGVVIVILVAIGLNESNKKKQVSPTPEENDPSRIPKALDPHQMPTSFELFIWPDEREFGGTMMDCLVVKIRGPINLPPNNLLVSYTLTLWDVTAGADQQNRKPVFCSIPELQMKGTQVFLWTHIMQMPYASNMLQNWAEILVLPLDLLTFPSRGERRLEFEIRIAPLGQLQNPAATSRYVYQHMAKAPGYIDGIKNRIKTEEMGLKLAAAVSAVDGEQDDTEKKIVRNWIDIRTESLPDNLRPEATRALSRALLIAERLGASLKKHEIRIMTEELINHYPVSSLPRGDIFDVVKLCFEVAAADGSAGTEELDLIELIAGKLGIAGETLTRIRDKIIPPDMYGDDDIDKVLGISPSWDLKRTKKHLRGLYREWSAKVTHSDPGVVAAAEKMLQMISQRAKEVDDQLY